MVGTLKIFSSFGLYKVYYMEITYRKICFFLVISVLYIQV